MMSTITKLLQKFVKLSVVARTPMFRRPARLGVAAAIEHDDLLASLPPLAMVIDVGADRGQFSLVVRRRQPRSQILAFEPRAEAAETYRRALATTRPAHGQVTVIERALSAQPGQADLTVLTSGDSSSLLRPAARLGEVYGVDTRPVQRRSVIVSTLAEEVEIDSTRRPVLLKIDVQGAELDVLRGAIDILDSVDFLYLEVSFEELYESQSLAPEVIDWVVSRGFVVDRIGSVSPSIRRVVQADVLFSRRAAP